MTLKKRTQNFLRKYSFLLLLVIIFLILFIYSYFSKGIVFSLANSDVSQMVDFINSFGGWGEVIFVLLVILEVVLAPVPPLGLYIVAGILFGGLYGGILILLGNTIGAYIDFKIARKVGEKFTGGNTNEKIKKKFDKFFAKYGGLSIFILRVNPLTTSDLVSYLAGLTKIKTRNFLIATTLGLVPLVFVQTYLGDIFIRDNPILSLIVIFVTLIYVLIFIYLFVIAIIKSRGNKKPTLKKIQNP